MIIENPTKVALQFAGLTQFMASLNPPRNVIDLPPVLSERFEPLRKLGEGAQKRVYEMVERASGQSIALYVIDRAPLGEDALRTLHRSVELQQSGPFVAPVFELIEQPTTLYLTAKCFAAGDLAGHLSRAPRGRLTLMESVRIGIQLSGAIAYAHQKGVIHRDVKPSNVLMDDEGRAFLSDFGFARHASIDAFDDRGGDVIVGTPAYLAPEAIRGRANESSDLYALGCLLYESAVGQSPFDADSPTESLRRQINLTPPRPSDAIPSLHPLFDLIVSSLLEKSEDLRAPDASSVRFALEALRDALDEESADEGNSENADSFERIARTPWLPTSGEVESQERIVKRASAGESLAVLVEGDAGVGKSRWVSELTRRAAASGVLPLVVRADEVTRTPLGVLARVFRPLGLVPDAAGPTHAERSSAQFHARSAIRDLLGLQTLGAARALTGVAHTPFQNSGSFGPEAASSRSMPASENVPGSIWGHLRRFVASHPTLLVLDDLHWADDSSLTQFATLFEAIARGFADMPGLAVVATSRPLEENPRIQEIVKPLLGERSFDHVEVESLDRDRIHRMLIERGILRPSTGLVNRIHEATRGNPLYAELVIDTFRREGGMAGVAEGPSGTELAPEGLRVPESIGELIRSGLDRVPEILRSALRRKACDSEAFGPDDLSASQVHRAELLSALEQARKERVVVGGGDHWRIAHPLIVRVLYDELDEDEREAVHHETARRALAVDISDEALDVYKIAFHLLRSGEGVSVSEILEWTHRAGAQAFMRGGWSDAAQLFEQAIEVLASRGFGEAGPLGELHLEAALGLLHAQDVDPCIRHLERAADYFSEARDARGRARALAYRLRAASRFGALTYGERPDLEPLEKALEAVDPNDLATLSHGYGMLAELYFISNETERASERASQAVELARRAGDDRLCAEVLIQRSLAQTQDLRLAEAVSTLRVAFEHASRVSDDLILGQTTQRIAINLYVTGETTEAERVAEQASALNEVVDHAGEAAFSHSLRATIAAIRGKRDEVEQRAQVALELSQRAQYPWPSMMGLPALAFSRLLKDDWQGATDAIRMLKKPGVVFDDPAPMAFMIDPQILFLEAYSGEPVSIEEGQGGEAALPVTEGPFEFSLLAGICLHVELSDLVGRSIDPRARRALELAVGRSAVLSLGWPFPARRSLALCWLHEGDLDCAESELVRARAELDHAGAVYERARVEADLARVLVHRGSERSLLHAREVVDMACETLEGIGPEITLERAERLRSLVYQRTN